MKIYHLELEVYFALEEPQYKSEVYSNLDMAIQEGKYYLEKMMRNQYETGYYVEGKKNITVEELFSIERTDYIFRITEIEDLQYAEQFENDKYLDDDYLKQNIKPTHKIHYYNYKGELERTDFTYKKKQRLLLGSTTMYVTDFENGAGTKFKIGDLVTVIDSMSSSEKLIKDRIFVVRYLPRRIEGQKYFKNSYALISVFDEEIKGLFTFEIYEKDIKLFTGTIDPTSPIGILQKIIKGELKVSAEIWQKLENGEIAFDTRPNYKEVLNIKS